MYPVVCVSCLGIRMTRSGLLFKVVVRNWVGVEAGIPIPIRKRARVIEKRGLEEARCVHQAR